MISQELFYDYFTAVFSGIYRLDVRLDAVFKASSVKDALDDKDNTSFYNRYNKQESPYENKVPKLLINLVSKEIKGLPFANDTKLMYTKEKVFFRIYTNQDLQILKRNLRVGIRRKQLTGMWNLRLEEDSLRVAVSMEGFSTLTGYILYGAYEGTAGTVRPLNAVEVQ